MLTRFARAPRNRAFTLVEMVAVLVIISILASVGWVGYTSVRQGIQRTQTKDLLRSVSAAQEAQYRSRGAFVSSAGALATVASNEAGYAAPATDPGQGNPNRISVATGQAYGSVPVVGMAAWSASGDCVMRATFAPGSDRKALEGQATAAQLASRSVTCSGLGALTYLRVSDQPADGAVPNAPTNLTVAAGPGLLNLAWAAPAAGSKPAGYRLYRAVSPTTSYTFVADVVGATSFTDSGLDKDTTYVYYTTAYNGAGTSPQSNTATGRPLDPSAVAPTRPLGLTADPVTATSVTLRWSPVSTAAGYRVFRNGAEIAVLDPSDANGDGYAVGTQFVDTGVAPGVKYNYRIDAYSSTMLSSAPYPGINVVTPPAAVASVTATPRAGIGDATCSSPACVTVTWTASPATTTAHPSVPDASYLSALRSYRVYRCDAATCPAGAETKPQTGMTLAGSVSAGALTLTDTALPGSAQVTYRVYAVNEAGMSVSTVAATTRTVPAPVTGVSAVPAGAGKVKVSWTASSGAGATITGYRVYTRAANGNLTQVATVTAPTTTWTATGLPGFTEYTYVVAAVSSGEGLGLPSAGADVVTDPAPLTGITYTATTDTITLNWPRARGITYTVLRDGAAVATTTTGDYIDEGLTPGTQYSYVIRAANSTGGSADSAPVAAWTRPGAPTGLTATASGTAISLDWADTPGATGYRIYQCTGAGCTPTTQIGTSPTSSHSLTGLSAGTLYQFVVIAQNSSGDSATSDPAGAATAPTAPTLSATADPRQITLTWTASPAATSYTIWRDGLQVATTSTLTYTDSSVTGGGVYGYTVKALNNAGESLPSNTVSSSTAPDSPTGLVAAPGSATVALSWVATGATSYRVYRCAGVCEPTTADLVGTVSSGATKSYTDTGLSALTEYTYAVTAGNGTGWSAMSAPVTTRTTLDAPTNFRATGFTSTTVDLAWTVSAGSAGYRIYNGGLLIGTVTGGTTTSYTLTGLAPGTRLSLSLAAYAAGGESGRTAAVDVTTNLDAPTSLRTTSVTATSVALAWNTSAGAAGYQVLRCAGTSCTPAIAVATLTGGATSSYTDATVSANTAYRYAVVATTADATSPSSNVITAWAAPAKPTGLVVTAVTDSSATLQWPATTNATGYSIYRNGTLAGTTDAATTTFTDGGLSGGTTYSWTFTVTNAGGTSVPSDPATATLKPAVVTGLTATGKSRAVDVAWTAATSATSYTIQRCTGAGCTTGWTTAATATGTTATVTGLADNTTYGFRVVATNGSGDSTPSSAAYALTYPAPAAAPTFSGHTATSVVVSWASVTGATTYRLYQSGIGTPIYEGPAATYTVTGLAAGTAYTFSVASGNSSGYNAVGPSASTTTLPPAPTGLAETHTDTTITLSWAAATGASSYRVYVNGTFKTTVSGSTSTTITGLTPATAYSLTVSGVSAGGEGAQSAALPVTTRPASPVNVTWTAPARGTINLTWQAVTGASSYTVFQNGTAVGACTSIAGTSCSVTGLADATAYQFTVTANGVGGSSVTSNPVTATTLSAPPTGLAAAMSGTTATLTWTAPPGTVTGYKVYRCTGTSCTPVFLANSATTSYTDTGLAASTTYTWTVSAMTTGGESAQSTPATGTTVPRQATGLVLTGRDFHPDEMYLDWDADPTAAGFYIYRCAGTCTPTTGNLVATVPGGTTTTYTDTGLTAATAYSYRIAAYNTAGTGALSATASGLTVPNAPATPVVTGRTATSLTVSFGPFAPTVTAWRLYVGGSGSWVNVTDGSTSYTFTGLTPDTSYSVGTQAINSGGYSAVTGGVTAATIVTGVPLVTVTGTTGSTVSLSWDTVTGADEYRVYRGATQVGTVTPAAGAPTGTFTDTGLTPGTSYQYWVSSYGATSGYESPQTGPANATTTLDAPWFYAPDSPSATAMNLYWDAVTGATGYTLSFCAGASCTPTSTITVPSSACDAGGFCQYSHTGLTPGTSYSYHVKATSAVATSAASQVRTQFTRPAAPTGLTNMSTAASEVKLSWTSPGGRVTGYTVQRFTSVWVTVGTTTGTTYSDTYSWASHAESTRQYRVLATNEAGDSAFSNTVTVARPPVVTLTGGVGSVTATWPAISGATGYTAWFCAGAGPCNTSGAGTAIAAGTTTVTQTGLPDGAQYSAAVKATVSGATSAAGAATTLTAPPAPTGLVVTGTTDTSVALQWNGAPSATGYDMYRDGLKIGSMPAGATTYTDTRTNLLPPCLATGGDCPDSNKTTGVNAASGATLSVNWTNNQDLDTGSLKTALRVDVPARTGGAYSYYPLVWGQFAVTPGQVLTTEAYTLNTHASASVDVATHLQFFNASNTQIDTLKESNYSTLAPKGGYQRSAYTGGIVVPAGATYAKMTLNQVTDSTGASPSLTLYTDGWFAGPGPASDEWYDYYVKATNPAASAPSNTVRGYTNPTTPKRPQFPYLNIRSHTIPFTYDGLNTTDQFEVRWCVSAGLNTTCDPAAGTTQPLTTATQYVVTDAQDNFSATAQVRTKSAASGKYSAWTNVQSSDASPPAPTNVRAYSGTTGLQWNASAAATDYGLVMRDPGNTSWWNWPCTPANANDFESTGGVTTCVLTGGGALTGGKRYQVDITSSRAYRESDATTVYWLGAPTAAPGSVTGSVSGVTATVNWGSVTGATTYKVFQVGNATAKCTTAALTCTFSMAYGDKFNVYVVASNTPTAGDFGGGSGPNSAQVTLTAAPAGPTINVYEDYRPATGVTKPYIHLNWTEVNADTWDLRRCKSDLTGCVTLATAQPVATGYYADADTAFIGSVTYVYQMRQSNAAGYGPWATSPTVKPDWDIVACTALGADFGWSLDERAAGGTSTTADDMCYKYAAPNDGTIAGAPTDATPGAGPGHRNTGMRLDAAADTVDDTAAMPAYNATTGHTWAFSFRKNAATQADVYNGYFFAQGTGTTGIGLRRYPTSAAVTNTVDVVVYQGTANKVLDEMSTGTVNLHDGAWHDVVLVNKGWAFTLYVDGVQTDTASLSSANGAINWGSSGFNVGAWISGGGQRFGDYDDVAVWAVALTTAQVQSLYAAGR